MARDDFLRPPEDHDCRGCGFCALSDEPIWNGVTARWLLGDTRWSSPGLVARGGDTRFGPSSDEARADYSTGEALRGAEAASDWEHAATSSRSACRGVIHACYPPRRQDREAARAAHERADGACRATGSSPRTDDLGRIMTRGFEFSRRSTVAGVGTVGYYSTRPGPAVRQNQMRSEEIRRNGIALLVRSSTSGIPATTHNRELLPLTDVGCAAGVRQPIGSRRCTLRWSESTMSASTRRRMVNDRHLAPNSNCRSDGVERR